MLKCTEQVMSKKYRLICYVHVLGYIFKHRSYVMEFSDKSKVTVFGVTNVLFENYLQRKNGTGLDL